MIKSIKTFCKIPELRKVMQENKVVFKLNKDFRFQLKILDGKADDELHPQLSSTDTDFKTTVQELMLQLSWRSMSTRTKKFIDQLVDDKYSHILKTSDVHEVIRGVVFQNANKILEKYPSLICNLVSTNKIDYIDQYSVGEDAFEEIFIARENVFDELFVNTGMKSTTKMLPPFMFKILESKGFDTSNCYMVADGKKFDPTSELLRELPSGEKLSILYSPNEGHWLLRSFVKDVEGHVTCIVFDSLGSRAFSRYQLDKQIDEKVKNIYVNDLKIQHSKYGCLFITMKFLQYFLKTSGTELLEQIELLETGKECKRIKLFQLPVECLKLAQSMKYIEERNDILENKVSLGGVSLQKEISLLEYVKEGRDKYGVDTPDYSSNKLQNNLMDYFRAKYLQKAKELASEMSLLEVSDLFSVYDVDSSSSFRAVESQCSGDGDDFDVEILMEYKV